MKAKLAFEDAVDLLDADHRAVKKMFVTYGALCEDSAPNEVKVALANRICVALTIHAQIEEEIFYPAVRPVLDDGLLMVDALDEHAAAKDAIARILSMKPKASDYDAMVAELGVLIDQHVLREREQIFLKARCSDLDLRGLTLVLLKRQTELKRKATSSPARVAA